MSRRLAVILLVLTTIIWGTTFVAQKFATYSMGPLTFAAARYLLGGICVAPLAIWEWRKRQRAVSARHLLLLVALTLVFFVGTWLQQAALATTTVTSGGFLTGLYVFFVPLISLALFRELPHPIVWLSAPLALTGLYFLNGARVVFQPGDLLLIGCAICWAGHILLLGYLARTTGLPVVISSLSFIGAGLLSLVGCFILEEPQLAGLTQCWVAIAYAGILSTAVAFSLQAIAQQHVPTANVAIILSGESLFACLGGAIFLGERLTALGYAGAALLFLSIVLVEGVPAWAVRKTMTYSADR